MATHYLHPIQRIHGSISAPCSKSYAQRAIAIAACCKNPVQLTQYGESNDTKAAIEVVQKLGAVIKHTEDRLIISRSIARENHQPIEINIGEAGLSARMFSAFSLLIDVPLTINGHGSILNRPMDMVTNTLVELGKSVDSKNHCLPMTISGHVKSSHIVVDGSESSQFLTGLLIVLPQLSQKIELEVENLKSTPYIDMTIEILRDFNISIGHRNYQKFEFESNQQPHQSSYALEGDWSGAAFLAVAGAIGGEIELFNLNPNSAQADIAILEALKLCGARVTINNNDICIQKHELNSFEFDATNCPDLFPPLVALASKCHGTSIIKGLHRLTHKESDRGAALQKEFAKAGIQLFLDRDADSLQVVGAPNSVIEAIEFDSHNDHRIAMATALLSIGAKSKFCIANAEAIDKSYPNFFDDLSTISRQTKKNT